jgi:hypothetical protein
MADASSLRRAGDPGAGATKPFLEPGRVQLTCGHEHGHVEGLVVAQLQLVSVNSQEHSRRKQRKPLVAVDKRMIAGHGVHKRGGLRGERRISLLTEETGLRAVTGRIEQANVSDRADVQRVHEVRQVLEAEVFGAGGGPHALAITQDLTARFAWDLGYPTEVLLTYQAAYAVATSNAFTADGSDGHFAWCIAQLSRDDISEALGL